MKYYSEQLGRVFDTVEELEKAETKRKAEEVAAKIKAEREKAEKEKKAAERKSRAAEVEEARKNMVAAQKKYREVLEAFIKTYGSYHLSLDGKDAEAAEHSLFDIFNPFFFNF